MYSVYNHMFKSFDEVIAYAWDTFKIDFHQEEPITEDMKELLCRELERMIDLDELT